MVKYSPNENTYKEMYLINKFEKDVMENSLQSMRHDKTIIHRKSLHLIKHLRRMKRKH
jgi:hypothetical protein